MKYIISLLMLLVSSFTFAKGGDEAPSYVQILTDQICVNLDGNNVQCYQTAGVNDPVNVVYECPLAGDATVPLHINTGVSNPGPGVVALISKNPGEHPFLVDLYTFDSRGAQVNIGFVRTLYLITLKPTQPSSEEDIPCVCHATDPNAAEGCPDFMPFVDPPIP
jgi:hypothetical protein